MKLITKIWCVTLCALLLTIGAFILTSCDDECSHAFCTDWTVTKESTCNEVGIKERTCEDCGEVLTESIAKKTHKYSDPVFDNNVSCTSAGTTSSTCENCGDVKKEVNPGNPYGHTYFDGKCSACGETVDLIASYDASRTENDDVTVKIYKQRDGQLILDVVGAGQMADYTNESPAPWSSHAANVKTVHFYEGVTRLGNYAFNKLYSISNVMIERGLASVGSCVFDDAFTPSITYVFDMPTWVSLDFDETTPPSLYMTNLIYVGEVASDANGNKYVKNQSTSVSDLVIPEGVTKINAYAFYNCAHITSISLPKTVTEIGNYAFYGCSRLSEVHINDLKAWCAVNFGDSYANPVTVAREIFVNGELLQKLEITSDIQNISPYAFEGCTSIVSISLSGVTKISTRAFNGCSNVSSLTIDGLGEIGAYAFANNTALTELTLPDTLTSIGVGAFKNCFSLISVDLGDGITSLLDSVFAECRNLIHLELGSSVTAVDSNAFYGCNKIVEIMNRSNLDTASVPSLDNAFHVYTSGNSRITKILGDVDGAGLLIYTDGSTKTIVGYVGKSNSLTISREIVGGDYAIGSYAFYLSDLKNLTVKDGLISSNKNAFHGTSLKSIRLYGLSDWCAIDFYDESANPLYYSEGIYLNDEEKPATEISIPDGVESIKPYAFAGCGSITKIVIPSSVNSIGRNAFVDCTKATSKINGVYYISNWIVALEGGITTVTVNNSTIGVAAGVFDGAVITEIIAPISILPYFPLGGVKVLTVSAGNIPAQAFVDLTSLEKLSILKDVESVDPLAFSGLTAETVSAKYEYIGYLDPSKITSLTIISGSIERETVGQFTNLKSVTVGTSVSAIEEGSFAGLTSLESISVNAPISIPGNAFADCTAATSVSLSSSVKSIGKGAFGNCDAAKTERDGLLLIGNFVVGINTDKDYVVVGTEIVCIQDGVFDNDSGISRIFYKGKSAGWKKIAVSHDANPSLKSSTVYYYNEIKPASSGNFWRYVDGMPTIWGS